MSDKISVVLATYNGEKYIVSQMDSLREQTVVPHEVVICDDCSSDKTTDVIKEYIKKYNLLNWHLYTNFKNLGWVRNFYRGVNLSTGDLIFFCDQDDVWDKDKLRNMKLMFNDNKINVLSCKCQYIDANGEKISVSYSELPFCKRGNSKLIKHNFSDKFTYSIYPGCTMAVRKVFWNTIMSSYKINKQQSLPHDAVMWKMGVLTDSAYELNEELIKYRLHDKNASKPQDSINKNIKKRSTRIKEIEYVLSQMEGIKELYSNTKFEKVDILYKLDRVIYFHQLRKKYLKDETTLIALLVRMKYYRDIKMFLGDVLSKKRKEK